MQKRVQDFVLTSLYAIMNSIKSGVLTINGGSSSIKFSLYEIDESLKQLFYGEMEGIGTKHTKLSLLIRLLNKKIVSTLKLLIMMMLQIFSFTGLKSRTVLFQLRR